jgi:ornithine carbamoyltransferase
MNKRDFLSVRDFTASEFREIFQMAKDIKAYPKKYCDAMKGKELALIFQKTSTRTRASFEAGIHQMGGNAMYLDWRTTNFTLGDLEDEVRCLSRFCDIIMARVYDHQDVIKMAKGATVSVINGLSDLCHPCQALADLFTIEEKLGNLKGKKLVFVGDGSNNVAHSLIGICVILGMELTIASPPEYSPCEEISQWVKSKNASWIHFSHDAKSAVVGADVLYTDTFVSMGQENETSKRLPIFKPYQLNMNLVRATGKQPLIMHCLPAHREIEITSEVLDSPTSVVYDQSENRLHTQKALMLFLLGIKV